MLRSRTFTTSPRLSRFLSFSVEETLWGRQANLKEYIIGVEVFERTESFDPRVDAIVRVEARRLRSKVEQYYSNEGSRDEIIIYYERGSYSPRILRRSDAETLFHALVPPCMQKPPEETASKPFVNASNQEKLEKWLRYVLQATRAALWNLDTNTGAIIWSAEAKTLFGNGGPAQTLESFLKCVHEQDRDAFSGFVDQASTTGSEFELKLRIESPEFQARELVLQGASSGIPRHVIGIVRLAESD
jgi:PAS domain-containing protein